MDKRETATGDPGHPAQPSFFSKSSGLVYGFLKRRIPGNNVDIWVEEHSTSDDSRPSMLGFGKATLSGGDSNGESISGRSWMT